MSVYRVAYYDLDGRKCVILVAVERAKDLLPKLHEHLKIQCTSYQIHSITRSPDVVIL